MKFTVIIPTRDRADTLEWSLKTCLVQNYDDLQIIVSDNASQDDTGELVRAFNDRRVRYINTGKRLGMAQNWEFALGHVQDGFVLFIGDDDGLMPNAVQTANDLLSYYKLEALAWKKASYAWPSHIDPESRNCLAMTLRKKIEIKNSREVLELLCNFDPTLGGLPYELLPGLYNSFVSVAAINKSRSTSGRFFCSQIPDVYSAIALTRCVETYIYSFRPLSINGASRHSNGTSFMADPKGEASAKFLSEDNIPFHSDLVLAPSIPVIVAESVLQVRDNVPGCENYAVNAYYLSSEARRLSASLPKAGRELVDAALEKVHGFATEPGVVPSHAELVLRKGRHFMRRVFNRFENLLFIFVKRFPVSEVGNVYDASIECQKLDELPKIWVFLSSATRLFASRP